MCASHSGHSQIACSPSGVWWDYTSLPRLKSGKAVWLALVNETVLEWYFCVEALRVRMWFTTFLFPAAVIMQAVMRWNLLKPTTTRFLEMTCIGQTIRM